MTHAYLERESAKQEALRLKRDREMRQAWVQILQVGARHMITPACTRITTLRACVCVCVCVCVCMAVAWPRYLWCTWLCLCLGVNPCMVQLGL